MKTKFAAAVMITVAAGSIMAASAGAEEVKASYGPDFFGPRPHHELREPPHRHDRPTPSPPHEWRESPVHDRFEPRPHHHHDRPLPPPPPHHHHHGAPRGVPPRH
ncbi:MAG: hypothetical protein IJG30_07605 [Synergistaceae bacterium]|nr:hypothetical protein [Synergistaceae bacterium]